MSRLPEATPDLVDAVMKVVGRSALKTGPSLAYRKGWDGGGVNLWPLVGVAGGFALITAVMGFFVAFGGGDVQLINAAARIDLQTLTVISAVTGSLLVAGAAAVYSWVLNNN